MGCCTTRASEVPGPGTAYSKPAGPFLVKRDKKHFYDIVFPSKPFHITLTSSKDNTDGYITAVEDNCPIPNAKDVIVLNSKVVYVAGQLVEGCEVTVIAQHLQNGTLPLRLTMAHPDGLEDGEIPDLEPETIVHMQDKAN